MITATLYSDPACPWAYSESPALRVIEWRYGDQLDWKLVSSVSPRAPSSTPPAATRRCAARSASCHFAVTGCRSRPRPRPRLSATARACRAVVAARLSAPGTEWLVFRAIQLANFTTPLVLEDDAQLRDALTGVDGIDAAEIVGALDSPEVTAAYEADKAQTRTAAGSAAELQGKTATTDGPVRFTAPSVVFSSNGTSLVAGGFQPVEAYDILVANLDPTLNRRPAPENPGPLLAHFPSGLTTQEVAALMTKGNDAPDRRAAEAALIGLVAEGEATRTPLGDDALWRSA